MISALGIKYQDEPGLLNIKDKIPRVFIVFNCGDLFSILITAYIYIYCTTTIEQRHILKVTQTAAKILRRGLTTLDPQ